MRFENAELRALQAVVEEQGFKRAAERLSISQSAISQAVAGLENKLDTALLIRGKGLRGKQIRLSPSGQRVYDHACEVLRQETNILQDIENIKAGRGQILSLAITSTTNRFYAPQLIGLFCQQQPHVKLRIQEMPSRSIVQAVRSGEAELGLGPLPKHMQGLNSAPLYEEDRLLVAGPKIPNFSKVVEGKADALRRIPIMTSLLDNPDERPAIQRIRDNFAQAWEISSLSLRISLVEQGFGATYISDKLLREHSSCREFEQIQGPRFAAIHRNIGLMQQSGRIASPAAMAFSKHCQQFWA